MKSFLDLALATRMFAYLLVGAALFQGVVLLLIATGAESAGMENGLPEVLHIVIPALSAAVLFRLGSVDREQRSLYRILACLALIAAGRELDHYSREYVARHSYQLIAVPAALYAIYLGVTDRARVTAASLRFAATPAFVLFLLAVFTIVLYAQIIGQDVLWRAIMGDGYQRGVKNAVEELCELLGYVFLAFGVCETWIQAVGDARTGASR